VLRDGVPVYDRSGKRVGVVDHVLADDASDIFEGLIVHTLPLPGRHLYADHEQIAELRERGVLLSVGAEDLHEITDRSAARQPDAEERVENPLEAALRKAWDWVSGVR
jgi:uncharacterized protein YrrD